MEEKPACQTVEFEGAEAIVAEVFWPYSLLILYFLVLIGSLKPEVEEEVAEHVFLES